MFVLENNKKREFYEHDVVAENAAQIKSAQRNKPATPPRLVKITEFFEAEKAQHIAGQQALHEDQSGLSAVSETMIETDGEQSVIVKSKDKK